ncbi:hypothetical protein P170DRAFT_421221 [Aspergillus steynii IBT 23096]|uniref:Uncharacterized protein n=1 Tax=Aspergillus steynii IBT 23096 TaxID=1392250 RepID=A0A2I2GNS2_9EURO|nr:uncharacterized protein P170DRAFT_421221 [Aspergillus steynii IBT 23096]PLB54528.1 hypothetical protein P170DRAFT_421221 [Aspergillus steynii IBT 23096]
MDTTPEHSPEQRSDSSQQASTSVSSTVSNVGSSIGQIAGSSVGEVKNKLNAVYTSDSVQNVWEQVRSVATGGKAANNVEQDPDDQPDAEEIERIDNMEKEKIVEFLQDRNKSLRRRSAKSR